MLGAYGCATEKNEKLIKGQEKSWIGLLKTLHLAGDELVHHDLLPEEDTKYPDLQALLN